MKKVILLSLICCSSLVIAQTTITPPDLELGHWVTTADQSDLVEKTLASFPEETREMMRAMMEEKLQESAVTEECITADTLANFDKQIEDAFTEDSNCELIVNESSGDKFVATINCPGTVMNITTDVINSKQNETTLVSNIEGMGETTITSVSEWQSETCPAGL